MTLLTSCVMITKGVKVTQEGETRQFKLDEYRWPRKQKILKRLHGTFLA